MEEFVEIYNDELIQLNENELIQSIFNHAYARSFVYEVCKRVVVSQQAVPAGRPLN